MYFVYSGHINADNCDGERPTHYLSRFKTEEEVFEFKKRFDECKHLECSHVIFIIVEGQALKLEPVEHVVEWKIVGE